MSCDGFEHGVRIVATEDFLFQGRLIKKYSEGVIMAVYHEKHQIDVDFPNFGLIKGLPAQRFGVAAMA
jgi:hypothetical protein